ncbi:MAG TPA: hypothetical protein VJ043_01415 [Candidatus Paceibacterota bacterium]|nr:hypothetical protein [Candidatus Paceibacterota bacterium]
MTVMDKELEQRVARVSKKLGLTKREVINRAVSSYIGRLDNLRSLYSELQAWDVLSAEMMRKNNF